MTFITLSAAELQKKRSGRRDPKIQYDLIRLISIVSTALDFGVNPHEAL